MKSANKAKYITALQQNINKRKNVTTAHRSANLYYNAAHNGKAE